MALFNFRNSVDKKAYKKALAELNQKEKEELERIERRKKKRSSENEEIDDVIDKYKSDDAPVAPVPFGEPASTVTPAVNTVKEYTYEPMKKTLSTVGKKVRQASTEVVDIRSYQREGESLRNDKKPVNIHKDDFEMGRDITLNRNNNGGFNAFGNRSDNSGFRQNNASQRPAPAFSPYNPYVDIVDEPSVNNNVSSPSTKSIIDEPENKKTNDSLDNKKEELSFFDLFMKELEQEENKAKNNKTLEIEEPEMGKETNVTIPAGQVRVDSAPIRIQGKTALNNVRPGVAVKNSFENDLSKVHPKNSVSRPSYLGGRNNANRTNVSNSPFASAVKNSRTNNRTISPFATNKQKTNSPSRKKKKKLDADIIDVGFGGDII